MIRWIRLTMLQTTEKQCRLSLLVLTIPCVDVLVWMPKLTTIVCEARVRTVLDLATLLIFELTMRICIRLPLMCASVLCSVLIEFRMLVPMMRPSMCRLLFRRFTRVTKLLRCVFRRPISCDLCPPTLCRRVMLPVRCLLLIMMKLLLVPGMFERFSSRIGTDGDVDVMVRFDLLNTVCMWLHLML